MLGFITRRRLGAGAGAILLVAGLAACSPGTVRGTIPSANNQFAGVIVLNCGMSGYNTSTGNCRGVVVGHAGGQAFVAVDGSGGFGIPQEGPPQDCTSAPCPTNEAFQVTGTGHLGGVTGQYTLTGYSYGTDQYGTLYFSPAGSEGTSYNFSCNGCLTLNVQPGHIPGSY
ncbi:MAG TPA: hypothetical protein VFB58_05260 [Chloroflexota bacterium]|nr:hypothetical protein [Chloroflexota bacterium]